MANTIYKRFGRRAFLALAAVLLGTLLLPDSVDAGKSDSESPGDVAVVPGPDDAIPDPVEGTDVIEPGLLSRLVSGNADGLDWFLFAAGVMLIVALVWIIWSYVRGLRGSPRELYLMFFTKVTEFSAYGAANMAFVLYLNRDRTPHH